MLLLFRHLFVHPMMEQIRLNNRAIEQQPAACHPKYVRIVIRGVALSSSASIGCRLPMLLRRRNLILCLSDQP
jgi:hypothetical protein